MVDHNPFLGLNIPEPLRDSVPTCELSSLGEDPSHNRKVIAEWSRWVSALRHAIHNDERMLHSMTRNEHYDHENCHIGDMMKSVATRTREGLERRAREVDELESRVFSVALDFGFMPGIDT